MIPAALLAMGLGLGADIRGVVLVAGAVYFPIPMAGLVAFLIWRARAKPSVRSSQFCDAVAGELRSGQSLRNALDAAARSVGADRISTHCRAGAALDQVALDVAREFPDIAREMVSLIGRAPSLGSPSADLFDEVGNLALAQTAVTREVSAATAPARATAVVLFGGLVLGVGWAVGTGGLAPYTETSSQRFAAVVGLLLVVVGLALAGWMLLRNL